MISDEERREVAHRLREHSGAKLFTGDDVERLIGAEPSGFRPEDADTNYNLLADLIEPTCDRDAMLALADDLDYAGANVENVTYIDQTFHDAVRRMRKALGMSDD